MSGKPATVEALRLLERELQAAERERSPGLDGEDAWRAFLRFGRLRFATADTPDADGLLVQYGTHAFDGPATFTLDFARQFEAVDSDGDHEHYVQVHCELHYRPVPALQALGTWSSWYFHDAEDSPRKSRSTRSRCRCRRSARCPRQPGCPVRGSRGG
ncbi:hypothetical protein ACFWBX_27290 [Streptomyces sp. NPDC059991]|uniref:hypothetical protein n=1 Tax=Streptomyces sp. NPDC059991 TaxID=3347028 RepID=UPI0036A3DD9C